MLADTFLKRRLSAWNLTVSHHGTCHTLVLVKNDSKSTEKLIKYAIENGKDDFITILCVLKLPVATDLLLGRVLEPLGDEDMVNIIILKKGLDRNSKDCKFFLPLSEKHKYPNYDWRSKDCYI